MSERAHIVEQGDCISKIAFEMGYTWKQIWNHSENRQLKRLRKDPNVLMPGDVVVLPDKKKKDKKKATGSKHGFQRNKDQSKLKIRLLVDGEPIKNKTCSFFESGTERLRMGRTNADGVVEIEGESEFPVLSKATYAALRVGEEPNSTLYEFNIGYLNPHDDTTGVQQRLNNLGYNCGAVDGNVGERLESAIRWFQRSNEMEDNGEIDKKFQKKLKDIHGS